ncbi:MAG: T9SS type A sorting domain-containing protein [bacterium]
MYLLLKSITIFLFSIICFAQWSTDPSVNTPVNIDEYMQTWPDGCTDMNGGAIVVWREKNSDIYAQRLDKYGYMMWDSDGIPICTEDMEQWPIDIISDGKGGAIVLWQDYRKLTDNISRDFASNTLYVQRINADGQVLWNENGIQLSDFRIRTDYIINQQIMQTNCEGIISDCHGGAYICWTLAHDSLMGQTQNQIAYIQHVDSTGSILWDEYGKTLLYGISAELSIVSDDSSGVYCYVNPDSVYRFDYDGNMLWDIALYLPTRWSSTLVSDGLGGFYAVGVQNWPGKVIMYRVDRQGNILLNNWNYEDEKGLKENKLFVDSDTKQGLFLRCRNYDGIIHMLRISPNGNILWENHGDIDVPALIDNFGNWFYLYSIEDSTYRIYEKKYDIDGNPMWGENGILIRARTEDWGWLSPWNYVADQNGGLIMLWSETRHLTQYWDIMGQQVNSDGELGNVVNKIKDTNQIPEDYILLHCYPNPFNSTATISYRIFTKSLVKISVYNISGYLVDILVNKEHNPGNYIIDWDASILSSGIYLCVLSGNRFSQSTKMALIK